MLTALLRNKRVMPVAVVVLAVVASALTVLLLGGGTTEILYGLGGGVVASAAIVGVYALGRRYGHPHSHAVAEAAVALGVLYLGLLVNRLVTNETFGLVSSGELFLGLGAALVGSLLVIGLSGLLGRYGTAG